MNVDINKTAHAKQKSSERQRKYRLETETAERASERKKKDAERKNTKRRQSETPEQASARKKKDAERKKRYRETLKECGTPNELKSVKRQNAENQSRYMKAKRQRLEKSNIYYAERLKIKRQHAETPEKASERKKKDAERKKTKRRQSETPEQASARKKKDAERKKRYRETLKECGTPNELKSVKRQNAENQSRYMKAKRQRLEKSNIARKNLTTFDETAVDYYNVGLMTYKCVSCGALMFQGEQSHGTKKGTFSLCCAHGKVSIPPVKEPPEMLKLLLTDGNKKGREFRNNIRAYNSSLAFASLYITGNEYKFPTNGPYCFRINGQIYHMISQMHPSAGQKPGFSQIYIYDKEHELENRLSSFANLDKILLKELQEMMTEVNPYAQKYIHVGNIISENPTQDVQLVLKTTRNTVDPRRYNLPTGTDIAVVIPADNNDITTRDVVIHKSAKFHPTGQSLTRISSAHPMYDPLMYVLMFPHGDKGWELNAFTSKNRQSGKCSAMQFYRYRLMVRGNETFNTVHRMGRLFQQYIVDMYVKVESERLSFIRHNQKELRAELYQGLADALNANEENIDGSQIGKRVILPSSFTGGARFQQQLYQDAMGIVRRYGKPDFFITFTCNPNWKEITDELLDNQTSADRPDLVSRVFKLKLQELLHNLYYGPRNILGKMVALIYVIEWQKRGPPHAHILAICNEESKPRTPDDYDEIVCAEIPNPEEFPELHKIVTTTMIHGPCGLINPNSPCMVDGVCSKKFPKDFSDRTISNADGYPIYRRRDNGHNVLKNGVRFDNRHVVPYNPYLSKKFNAHINVEICSSVKCCKYLYKYVYKGPDMTSVSTKMQVNSIGESDSSPKAVDEIEKFVNARFVTANEAFWRICSFDIHGRDPCIQRLAVHEENCQTVTFNESNPEEGIANAKDTTLLAWFKLNQRDPQAHKYKYHEIPEHYVWKPNHAWARRKRGRCIGRMYITNPSQGERHYLRILLHHIPGAKSFHDLKISLEGKLHDTYKETALALGLLECDTEWKNCLSEASVSFMASQLRSLFVTILVFGEPSEPLSLWMMFKESMGQDLARNASCEHINSETVQQHVENNVLYLLQQELEGLNMSLSDYGLPVPAREDLFINVPKVIRDEIYDVDTEKEISNARKQSLNEEQRKAFDRVMEAVNDEQFPERVFFLNAPGGCGKTFLITTLLSAVRSLGKIALAVASSGIAAELLAGGRTAHSRFKIPIPINETSMCGISLQSSDAKLMRRTSLIIWDEVMMSHVNQVDCVDRSLRDIMKLDKPFGGIVTVFGGDPRQILPVVRHGNRAQIIKACLQTSTLWSEIHQIKLTENMRLRNDEIMFSKFLLAIGDGNEELHPEQGEDMVQIPKGNLVESIDALIDKTFPHIADGYLDKYYVSRRAILTPKNEHVDKLNDHIMEQFPGLGKRYLSADTIAEEDLRHAYPTEFLNSITLSGMPPHAMTLKVGAPVILLRNLRSSPGHGLRNGTRMIIKTLGEKVVEAEIASGSSKGRNVLIPRITIAPSDTELPFTLRRRQFPIRPCFVMSTNKAQGQTLDFVGVYLPDHVFTHGQLYVALSRVRSSSSVAVYVNNKGGFTKNIVYKEVLE